MRKEGMSAKAKRRLIFAGTIMGVLGIVAGFAFATGFTQTTNTQSINGYETSYASVAGLAQGSTPLSIASPSSCTTGTAVTTGASGAPGTVSIVLAGQSGTCATSDYMEEFSFVYTSQGTTTVTLTFNSYSTVGASPGTTTASSGSLTVTNTASGDTADISVYVDYPGGGAPSGGISMLDLVVS